MRRSFVALLGSALAAAVVLLGLCVPIRAAEAPAAGTWKVVVYEGGAELTLWLVKIEDKKGKLQAEVLSVGLPNFQGSKVESVKASAKALDLTIKTNNIPFAVTAFLPKDDEKPRRIKGFLLFRGIRLFAELERTELTELDKNPAKNQDRRPLEALTKAEQADDDKEKEDAFQAIIKKYPARPAAMLAHLALMRMLAKNDKPAADIRKHADGAVKIAGFYGPPMKLTALLQVARALKGSKELASEAVTFARQAEKMLTKDDPPAEQAAVLKVLTSALHKAGKADEAKYLQVRLQKIEETLDRDFLKDAIPFKPEPYGGRKGKSNRVAVVELFTGAQCPPCVAADVAFDALLKTYKPSDVVFLQYHLHVPGPDPLTNSDSEKRSGFYGVRGTPTFYLDGGDGPGVGGPKQASERAYGALQSALNEALESDAKAKLKLKATRKGDKIDMTADYDGLEKPGENMRLLFALVEDVARYQGSNGQRLHHHVVRSLPNGPEGKALEKKSGNQSASVSISDLTKSLEKYLAAFSKKRNYEFEDQPMDLKKLKVVAFIQDNDSKKILQAAQVDLEEK